MKGKNFAFLLFAVFVMISILAISYVKAQPQRNSQRGRAISGFSRANEADYEDSVEEDTRPRKYGRRGYRSNCRCAKISNCPKIQITIPRCPPEEFVCCFN